MLQPKDRLSEWLQKQNLYTCYLNESHFRSKDVYRQKMRDDKKIFNANKNQKKAGGAILISGEKNSNKDCYRDKVITKCFRDQPKKIK